MSSSCTLVGHAAAIIALVVGCSAAPPLHASDDAGLAADCGANLKHFKTACVPILDDCKDNEVPIPGGGCKRVGVAVCTVNGGSGIAGPPNWNCKPIGPPRTCLKGWTLTKDSWCEPVVPDKDCPKGTMPVIGSKTCQPVGDCGTGKWGKVKLQTDAIFVDGSYNGDSKGNQSKPFTTIVEALKHAPAGGQVVVAAGEYIEHLRIRKAVTLEGVCAQKVTLRGSMALEDAPIDVARAIDVVVRSLTVADATIGISISNAAVSVENVVLEGCDRGLSAVEGADVTLRSCLVTHSSGAAVWGGDSQLVLHQSSIVDNERGVRLHDMSRAGALVITDSLIKGTSFLGVSSSASARIERTLVAETTPSDGKGFTAGLNFTNDWGGKEFVVLRDVVVADNSVVGFQAFGVDVTLDRVIVRDTQPGGYLHGVGVQGFTGYLTSARFNVRDSVIARNARVGFYIEGGRASITRTVIKDTTPVTPNSSYGAGIYARGGGFPSTLHLRESLVDGNSAVGVELSDTAAIIDRTVVRDTRSLRRSLSPSPDGVGILLRGDWQVANASSLAISQSTFDNNHLAAIYADRVGLSCERTLISGTKSAQPSQGRAEASAGMIVLGPQHGSARRVSLRDVSVVDNEYLGLFFAGAVDVQAQRVAVSRTRPGKQTKLGGIGLWVSGQRSGKVQWVDSVFVDNALAGAYFEQITATIQRSFVSSTKKGADGRFDVSMEPGFGDGVVANKTAYVAIEDVEVASSARAGVFYAGGSGRISRSLLRKGNFSIVLGQSATPVIASSNVMLDNVEDRVTVELGARPPELELPAFPGSAP